MLTKEMLQKIRLEVAQALKPIAEKYDGIFTVGNIKYDDTKADINLTLLLNGEDGESAEEVEFNKYARAYGFGPADYGKVIFIEGVAYQFYGFAPKARKYPCLLRKVDGQGAIKATLDTVKKHLGL
jgi:hypothetical protein